ncbi:MAG TPA: AzlD domain-containing protein [Anaerolineales bacterium]|nr:AzlD domain-containing protein [Anaerolineales bacterium]
MTGVEIWAVILGGMVVTYGTRLSFILLPHPERFPEGFRRGLRLVAPAVLAAILVPQVFVHEAGQIAIFGARPAAAVIAAVIGWRTRNTWLAIGGGMISLWILLAAGA